MRADMDKVIVERPRYGSRDRSRKKGYRKYIQATPFELLPNKEPLLGHWRGMSRSLNEHLGPMRRFLRSNIGRPWNKVHQELCEHVSFDNAVQAHVLVHINQYVEQHVIVEDSATVFSGATDRRSYRLTPGHMYVCPRTGLLKQVKRAKDSTPVTRVNTGRNVIYLRCDGAWWEVQVRGKPECFGDYFDVWFERPVANIAQEERIGVFGRELFATSKRPLTREETQQLHKRLRSS